MLLDLGTLFAPFCGCFNDSGFFIGKQPVDLLCTIRKLFIACHSFHSLSSTFNRDRTLPARIDKGVQMLLKMILFFVSFVLLLLLLQIFCAGYNSFIAFGFF